MSHLEEKKTHLPKEIGFFGFLALGIGGVFGASWLVMTGTWLDLAGGPINALIAMFLCILIELPFALAYLEAVPMIPLAGGEIAYAYLAFNSFWSFIAGWFGILATIALCAWETLAITSMVGYLFPAIHTAIPLYKVGDFTVTAPLVILGLLLVSVVGFLGYRGVRLSVKFQMFVVYSNLFLVILAAILLSPHFNFTNFQPLSVKPTASGVFALLVILPFSIAAWDTVAKGAGEASEKLSRGKVGLAVILSLIIGACMYMLTVFVPSAIVPWTQLLQGDIPFATAASNVMGTQLLGYILIAAAILGVLAVYNASFYGATRLLYSLGEFGLIPSSFCKLHPKYKTPTLAIIFVTILAGIAPFVGKPAFLPLVNSIAFSYIVLWSITLFSVIRLRKTQPQLHRPVKMPAAGYLGVFVTFFMLFALLYPGSPGALAWPEEYLLLLGLLLIGMFLYSIRRKDMSEQERAQLILGDIAGLVHKNTTTAEQEQESCTQA